ncbi:hypothetical protein DL93DRAFT_2170226 [Clavulina sp. PMI_390]|nr:hypothetical protein DL93DRAFT_2170226 [Clavulina sp. PMI_390]
MGAKTSLKGLLDAVLNRYSQMDDDETMSGLKVHPSADPLMNDSTGIWDTLTLLKIAAQELVSAIDRELGQINCRQLRLVNSQKPFVKLPVELLGHIFAEACSVPFPHAITHDDSMESEVARVVHTLFAIGLTCCHWRSVLLSTPAAWRHVTFIYPKARCAGGIIPPLVHSGYLAMIRLQFERSRALKHRIYVDLSAKVVPSPSLRNDMVELGDLIAAESLQAEILHIRTHEPTGVHIPDLLISTPSLPHLRYLHLEWDSAKGSMHLDLSSATGLQVLSLSFGASNNASMLSFVCPHIDQISEIHLAGWISLLDSWHLITRCRQTLKKLGWTFNGSLSHPIPPQPIHPIELPQLHSLAISALRTELLVSSKYLTLPALETVSMGTDPAAGFNDHNFPRLRVLQTCSLNFSSFLNSHHTMTEEIHWTGPSGYVRPSQNEINSLFEILTSRPPSARANHKIRPPSQTVAPIHEHTDPFPALKMLYLFKNDSNMPLDKLLAASRGRSRPFVVVIPREVNTRSTKAAWSRAKLEELRKKYPGLLDERGPTRPPIFEDTPKS